MCVYTRNVRVFALMRPKAKQFNKKRNLNSAKQNIYMYATEGVWADGGAELEPLTSACGFFFLYPTAPAVPLTRETTDMTSHMFV